MKRTPLLRKTPLKARTTLKTGKFRTTGAIKTKRKNTYKLKPLKTKLWDLCRKITFLKYGNTCYTTGQQNLEGYNLQCGHGKPKGSLQLKYQYDLRNLRPQSMNANINMGGMSDIFIAKLEKEKEGLEFLKETCYYENGYWKVSHKEPPMGSMQAYAFLKEKIEEYQKIYDEMLRMSQRN